MARLTLNVINKAIAAEGGKEELIRGNGYFYFWSDDAAGWYRTSVYVYHLGGYTLEQWLKEWRTMRDEARNH